MFSVLSKPTRRVSAKVRSLRNFRTTPANVSASAVTNSAQSPAGNDDAVGLSAALVRQSLKIAGVDGIALTKLDVLDGFDELKVCVGYRIRGKAFDYLPAGADNQAAAEPVYETIKGWSGSTERARSWADLPAEAVKYVRRIEELIETPGSACFHQPGTGRRYIDA